MNKRKGNEKDLRTKRNENLKKNNKLFWKEVNRRRRKVSGARVC